MEFIPRLWRYLGPIFTWHKDTRNPLSLCNLVSLGIRKEFENYARLPPRHAHYAGPSLLLFICWCCDDPGQQQNWGLANEQQLRFGREWGNMLEGFWNIEHGLGPRYASFRKHNEKYCTSITRSQYTLALELLSTGVIWGILTLTIISFKYFLPSLAQNIQFKVPSKAAPLHPQFRYWYSHCEQFLTIG